MLNWELPGMSMPPTLSVVPLKIGASSYYGAQCVSNVAR